LLSWWFDSNNDVTLCIVTSFIVQQNM
jgi:hypothetical protein